MSNEPVTLVATPGLFSIPDETEWAKCCWRLTVEEEIVYLFLRWVATRPGGIKSTSIKELARNIGDREEGWKWFSRGPMNQTKFHEAVKSLARKGLLEIDEDEMPQ